MKKALLHLIIPTLLLSACSEYDSGLPYWVVNETNKKVSGKMVFIDVITEKKIRVNEEIFTISPGEYTTSLAPEYDNYLSKYVYIEIIENDETIYTYRVPSRYNKSDIIVITNDPLEMSILPGGFSEFNKKIPTDRSSLPPKADKFGLERNITLKFPRCQRIINQRGQKTSKSKRLRRSGGENSSTVGSTAGVGK